MQALPELMHPVSLNDPFTQLDLGETGLLATYPLPSSLSYAQP